MLNLKRGIGTHEPSVISLGQVWVDIMLNVDKVPAQGGFAVADHPKPSIGGSYRVLQAASRMGVPTEHAGILGNGLWAHFIRQSFQDNGITHIGQDRLDEDSGFRVVLSSGAPKKTFIASYGAEAHGDSDTFDTLEPQPKDVVHISGNTLMDHTATGVDGFLLKAGTDPAARDYTLVINPTNTLRLVNDHMLEDLVLARPVWSCNRQEAMTLAERLGAPIDDSKVTADLTTSCTSCATAWALHCARRWWCVSAPAALGFVSQVARRFISRDTRPRPYTPVRRAVATPA